MTAPADVAPDGQQGDGPQGEGRHEYGFPAPLWRAVERARPPLRVLDARVWKSPLRGPWLTAVFGAVLLVALPVVIVTGFLSYAAYEPRFPGNAYPVDPFLRFPHFAWPASPSWLFRLNQGLHVGLGLALVPVVLAKLWSVIPKLFVWPPARSVSQLLERLTIALLVGGILFELATGVLNIQYDYVFGFDFYTGHYYGAWVFLAAFLAHVVLKLPVMLRSLRTRSLREELRTPTTAPEPPDPDGLVAPEPDEGTMSRRGALALVGGAALTVTAVTAGQTLGDAVRPTALLSPRGQSYGDGPTDFQVNRTAPAAGITEELTGPAYRLELLGPTPVTLTLADLRAMPQHTVDLPIACVEGWSTVQTWTGVRLRDLVGMAAGATPYGSALVSSLERNGAFARAVLGEQHLSHPDSLLALQVNGVDLSPDHGYPARVICPSLPGVHNTKWVRAIEVRA